MEELIMNILEIDMSSSTESMFFTLGLITLILSVLLFVFAIQRLRYGTSGFKYSDINERSKQDRKIRFKCHFMWSIVFLGVAIMTITIFFLSK
ncbi:MAG: hypothetical protein Q8K30_00410 [Candidatus Gracilibacteria bacterium]|nr:hypothetical protein [Candidatus Gracilibacteria bacterium]MDP2395729.1 hypothetical protein [bacterium]MDP3380415.1 hypothetical protein [bacterium]